MVSHCQHLEIYMKDLYWQLAVEYFIYFIVVAFILLMYSSSTNM